MTLPFFAGELDRVPLCVVGHDVVVLGEQRFQAFCRCLDEVIPGLPDLGGVTPMPPRQSAAMAVVPTTVPSAFIVNVLRFERV